MDDLASLDWTASSQQQQKPVGRSAFDYLATGGSRPPSRPITPALARSPVQPSAPISAPKSNGSDAFSSLFEAPKQPSTSNLSMAERLGAKTPSRSAYVGFNLEGARTSSDPWDFDLLTPATSTSAPIKPVAPSPAPSIARPLVSQPSDDLFDFGESSGSGQIRLRADADDILGELARPPSTRPTSPPVQQRATSPLATQRPISPPVAQRLPARTNSPAISSSRGSSPPPHVLGQLVEMGFGINEARTALVGTSNGGQWDVQAAAEALMGAQDQDRPQRHASPAPQAERRRRVEEQPDRSRSPAQNDLAGDLLAQASEIGLSVFKQAGAYWKTGRKVVVKAVEERMAAQSSSSAPRDGRPKWMIDAEANGDEPEPAAPASSFRDEDDDVLPQRPQSTPRAPQPKPAPPREQLRAPVEEPRAYVSPNRHRKPASSAPAPVPPQSKPQPRPQPVAAAPPKSRRPLITATPAQMSTSSAHKAKGTEHFKLGRFSDAEQAYSQAIEALPVGHLDSLSLLNNRASARLKTGDDKGAIDDATKVVIFTAADNEPMMREALGKALARRARGFEASERWQLALEDWTMIQRGGEIVLRAAGGPKLASEGVIRCRKAIDPKPATPAPPRPKTAPPVRRPAAVERPSAAVNALRQANATATAEDAERLAVKDSVDERLTAWKGGKETNLRALIASLDNVLWPELGWKKVGMHELISDSQLKIRYVRAIAKVHPDKTTVEQRMIANGVFGALNDAWTAQK